MSDATESTTNSTIQPDTPETGPGNGRRRSMLRVAIVFVVLGILAFIWWFLEIRNHETTEDAYVSAHIVLITPQIGGTVTSGRCRRHAGRPCR